MNTKLVFVLVCLCATQASCYLFSANNLKRYSRIFQFDGLLRNESGNELWRGLFRDCDRSVTFSCIQKNAYTYLDDVFIERDNITVFDGLTMTKNDLDYGTCRRKDDRDSLDENLVEGSGKRNCDEEESEEEKGKEEGRQFEENRSPLEEVTNALRKRAVKFLATRDYQIQLPKFFFEGATVKISPREIDENGALVRVDFGQTGVQSEGRIFKKIKKFIQNKLLTSLLALLLIIKLIKVKFMFIIPFLFGVGTAKKLFLKLLLFFIPAFAHVFKLCSSFYTAHSTKFHHHHHQIAHHHHHVPVPVPIPAYYNHHHHHHDEEDFDGYDYAHPHIQYRKDIEELKEWGIEPNEEPYDDQTEPLGAMPVRNPPGVLPAPYPAPYPAPTYAGAYGIPQYAANTQPIASPYPEKRPPVPVSAHNLAYSAYVDNNGRRTVVQAPNPAAIINAPSLNPANLPSTMLPTATNVKSSYTVFGQQNPRHVTGKNNSSDMKVVAVAKPRQGFDDEFYGPIINRLEEIFKQLRFVDEACRERLVCSMYKNPTVYSPHSNLVSNELSRDPQELKRGGTESSSSRKFHRYMNAARLGQDGGDCLRTYPCHINTE
ncbi:hypothetical protein WH47_04922 [Habropoda laboriosa]|uniref:Uncharacterized protein n=1 Tax=Habropoda laboriosa TaxID=597456 RepID=A0A0L7RJN2_9HYME|nr:PREDICTED: uncharacterized protein LOC108570385 [Habropoda laboriosa]KOC70936.1 hypothetical protein WH47_04922 [Habropoda laboriosa]